MRWADLDSLNHVNNVVYVDYAAESRAILTADGLIDRELDVVQTSVRYARPLGLTRHPVLIASTLDGNTVIQEIGLERDGTRMVHAKVTTTLGVRAAAQPADVGADVLPCRVRRNDLDSTGYVGHVKTFELFQEGRVLYLSNHLPRRKNGQFVVGTVSVDYHEPVSWRPEPYDMRSWVSRVGAGSLTVESELADGDIVLARGITFMVGYDLAAQKSRAFSPEERAVFDSLKAPAR